MNRDHELPRSPEVLKRLFVTVGKLIDYLQPVLNAARKRLLLARKLVADRSAIVSAQRQIQELKDETKGRAALGGPDLDLLLAYFPELQPTLDKAVKVLSGRRPPVDSPSAKSKALQFLEWHATTYTALIKTARSVERRLARALNEAADKSADKKKILLAKIPQNKEVLSLIQKLNVSRRAGQSDIEAATEFTNGDVRHARNLLRQVRRFNHLLEPAPLKH